MNKHDTKLIAKQQKDRVDSAGAAERNAAAVKRWHETALKGDNVYSVLEHVRRENRELRALLELHGIEAGGADHG